tara:strand:- start:86 stop:490 length:405 start_codon:yes stop_codon:yes gene_type:complete
MNNNNNNNNNQQDNNDNIGGNIFESIFNKNKKKEIFKLKTYNKILGKCLKKIKWAADNDQYYILFEIPKFCLDCPLYNISECAFYITQKLQNKFYIYHFTVDKLKTIGLEDNNLLTDILLISWNHIKKNLNKMY